MSTSNKYQAIVKRWKELPTSYPEKDLENHFINFIFEQLGIEFTKINSNTTIGEGLRADYLIFADNDKTKPLIVVEVKRREPGLANVSDEEFFECCKKHKFYRDAIGYEDISGNGIKQYLDKKKVDSNKLATYGLVINGDFFQLWKRVDGLIMPMTDIQRITEETIPSLIKQLEVCLKNQHRSLVTAIWNQKGGVAKTTNTINIGASLALAGKRVLLIDLDEQNDLTRGLGLKPENYEDWLIECVKVVSLRKSRERSQKAKEILKEAIELKSWSTNSKQKIQLNVLPIAKKSLAKFRESNEEYRGFIPRKEFTKIISLLRPSFDYIFIDASPAADPLTRCLLYSVDALLIPVDYGYKSIHHGVKLYNKLPDVRKSRKKQENFNLGAWNLGLMYSNCPADAGKQLNALIEKELQKNNFSGKRYESVIKTYAQAKIAEFKHAPVICWQTSQITKCYQKLVKEVFLEPNFIDE